jgi:hypothetical protein
MPIERKDSSDSHVFPENQTPLQVARWSGQRESVTSSGTSQRITLPTGADLIEISAAEAVYLNFGGGAVDATSSIADDGSRLFLAGVQVVPVPLDPATSIPYTHVAVLQVATAGLLQVEELV